MTIENIEQESPLEPEAEGEQVATEAPIEEEAPADELSTLRGELEEWQAKANENLDGWQRARAEFANYKKRIEREKSQMRQNAAAEIIMRFLDAVDDLERALKNRPQEGDGAEWAAGVDLIYRKFLAIMEAEGVTLMPADGQFFDPNQHEAISHEDNDKFESGQIIEVVKPGYLIGDRVLRPALVRVAK